MSFVKVSGSGGRYRERSRFYSTTLPKEVSGLHRYLNNIEPLLFKKISQECLLATKNETIAPRFSLSHVSKSVDETTLRSIYAGLYSLILLSLKPSSANLKLEDYVEDLKDLRLSEEHIAELVRLIFNERKVEIDFFLSEKRPVFESLVDFRWRLDVTISSSSLSRVLDPTILIQFVTSSGVIHSLEVSVAVFHSLRYNVATILHTIDGFRLKEH